MSIRVRANKLGYYGYLRRYPGDVFTVETESELGRWMERVPDDTPERSTTAGEHLKHVQDDLRGRPLGQRVEPEVELGGVITGLPADDEEFDA
jgi:hypothetical protein